MRLGAVRFPNLHLQYDDLPGGWSADLPNAEFSLPAGRPLAPDAPRRLHLDARRWTLLNRSLPGRPVQLETLQLRSEINARGFQIHNLAVLDPRARLFAAGLIDHTGAADLQCAAQFQLEHVQPFAPPPLNESTGSAAFINARLSGPLDNLALRGDWTLQNSDIAGAKLYGGGALRGPLHAPDLQDADMRLWGGTVRLQLQADGPQIQARAQNLSLQQLAAYFLPDLPPLQTFAQNARADGTFSARYENNLLAASEGEWTLRGFPYGGRGDTARATHRLCDGTLAASIASDNLNLRIEAELDENGAAAAYTLRIDGKSLQPIAELFQMDADGAFALAARAPNLRETRIELRLQNGSVQRMPIPDATLRAVWIPEAQTLQNADFALADGSGGSIAGGGSVQFRDDAPPLLQIEAQAEKMSLRPYAAALGAPGIDIGGLTGRLQASGPLDALNGEARLQIENGLLRIRRADLALQNGRIQAKNLRGTLNGVPWSVQIDSPDFRFAFDRPAPVQSAAPLLPAEARTALERIQGLVHLRIERNGERAAAHLQIQNASYAGAPLGNATATAELRGNSLRVDLDSNRNDSNQDDERISIQLRLNARLLEAAEAGAPFEASIRFRGVEAAPLAQAAVPNLRSARISGSAQLLGDLRDLRQTRVSALLDAASLQTRSAHLRSARPFRLRIAPDGASLQNLTLQDRSNIVHANMRLQKEGRFEMLVHAPKLSLQTAAELLNAPQAAAGEAELHLRAYGSLENPAAALRVSARSIAISPAMVSAAFPIEGAGPVQTENLRVEALYRDGEADVQTASLKIGGKPIVLRGQLPLLINPAHPQPVRWDEDAPFRLSAECDLDNLTPIADAFPGWRLQNGRLKASATLLGSPRNPDLRGEAVFSADALQPPGSRLPLRQARADLQIRSLRRLSCFAAARLENGSLTLRAETESLDPNRPVADLRLQAENLRLSDALGLLNLPVPAIEAEADGEAALRIDGPNPRNWTGGAALNRIALYNDRNRLESVQPAQLRYENGTAALRNLRLQNGEQTISAEASLDSEENLQMELQTESLDLNLLNPLLPIQTLPGGQLSADASIRGTPASPRFSVRWTLQNAVYPPIAADRIAGEAAYDGDALSLNRCVFSAGNNALQLSGQLPMRLSFKPGNAAPHPDPTRPVRLSLQADAFDISFAPLLLKQLKAASGVGAIHLQIEGPAQKPTLSGSVSLENGQLTLAHQNAQLDNVSALIQAGGDTVALQRFAFTADGGTYQLGGIDAPTVLAMDGLTPVFLQTSLKFSGAKVETWLPAPVQTELDGTAALAVDISGLSRNENADAVENWTQAVLQTLKQAIGNVRIEKAALAWQDRTARIAEPLRIRFENETFNLDNAQIQIEDLFNLQIGGEWKIDQQAQMPIRGYAAARLVQQEIAKRYGWSPELDGGILFSGQLSGPGQDPQLTLQLEGAQLKAQGIDIENAAAVLEAGGGQIQLREAGFAVGGNPVKMSGETHWNTGRFSFKFDADLQYLDFLAALFPNVARAKGNGSLLLSLGESFQKPRIQGGVQLQNLDIQIPDAGIFISEGVFNAAVQNEQIRVQQLRANLNGGTVQIDPGAPNVVPWSDPQNMSADIAFLVEGSRFQDPAQGIAFQAETARIRAAGPLNSLKLTGSAVLESFELKREWKHFFQTQNRTFQMARFEYPILRTMELDVSVQATREVEIAVQSAKANAVIDGRIVGQPANLIFQGEVSNITGQFSSQDLFGTANLRRESEFQITSGSIENRSATVFDPTYELRASTIDPLRNVSLVDTQGERRARDVDIQLHIQGQLSKPLPPNFNASVRNREPGEEYALTRQQTWELLAFGDASADAQTLAEAGVGVLAGGLGAQLGLGGVAFNVDADSVAETQFRISREFLPKLVIHYSSMLQVGQEQRFEFNYEVTDRLSISGERNEEGKYGADLQFSHEF